MLARRTLLVALVLAWPPLIVGWPLFGGNDCRDAQRHSCDRLPQFNRDGGA